MHFLIDNFVSRGDNHSVDSYESTTRPNMQTCSMISKCPLWDAFLDRQFFFRVNNHFVDSYAKKKKSTSKSESTTLQHGPNVSPVRCIFRIDNLFFRVVTGGRPVQIGNRLFRVVSGRQYWTTLRLHFETPYLYSCHGIRTSSTQQCSQGTFKMFDVSAFAELSL